MFNAYAFYLVYCPDGPAYGWPSARHVSEEAASQEAERLARQFPGRTFIVLRTLKACQKSDMAWTDLRASHPDEELPF